MPYLQDTEERIMAMVVCQSSLTGYIIEHLSYSESYPWVADVISKKEGLLQIDLFLLGAG